MKPRPMPPNNQPPRSHSQPTTQLTKRELFAAMAMQGLLAGDPNVKAAWLANLAIEYADALLHKLGEG